MLIGTTRQTQMKVFKTIWSSEFKMPKNHSSKRGPQPWNKNKWRSNRGSWRKKQPKTAILKIWRFTSKISQRNSKTKNMNSPRLCSTTGKKSLSFLQPPFSSKSQPTFTRIWSQTLCTNRIMCLILECTEVDSHRRGICTTARRNLKSCCSTRKTHINGSKCLVWRLNKCTGLSQIWMLMSMSSSWFIPPSLHWCTWST